MTIMTVIHNGRIYTSKADESKTPKEVAEAIYPELQNLNKLHFETEAGEHILIPGTALQESILIVSPTPTARDCP